MEIGLVGQYAPAAMLDSRMAGGELNPSSCVSSWPDCGWIPHFLDNLSGDQLARVPGKSTQHRPG